MPRVWRSLDEDQGARPEAADMPRLQVGVLGLPTERERVQAARYSPLRAAVWIQNGPADSTKCHTADPYKTATMTSRSTRLNHSPGHISLPRRPLLGGGRASQGISASFARSCFASLRNEACSDFTSSAGRTFMCAMMRLDTLTSWMRLVTHALRGKSGSK